MLSWQRAWAGSKKLKQCFSSLRVHMHKLEILLNEDSDSVGLEWHLQFCISNMFPGGNRAAGDSIFSFWRPENLGLHVSFTSMHSLVWVYCWDLADTHEFTSSHLPGRQSLCICNCSEFALVLFAWTIIDRLFCLCPRWSDFVNLNRMIPYPGPSSCTVLCCLSSSMKGEITFCLFPITFEIPWKYNRKPDIWHLTFGIFWKSYFFQVGVLYYVEFRECQDSWKMKHVSYFSRKKQYHYFFDIEPLSLHTVVKLFLYKLFLTFLLSVIETCLENSLC